MISKPLVGYILKAAARDRLLLTLALTIAVGAALAVFLGSSPIAEQGIFALVFAAAGLRIVGVIGLVLFFCFYVRRAFDNKEVEYLLSRPLGRTTFLLSHMAAFMALAVLVSLIVCAAVFVIGKPDLGGFVVWAASLAAEYAIMAAAALFFSMVLASAAGSALACLGLYVLSRLIGTLLGIAAVTPEGFFLTALAKTMQVISIFVPRLDLMGQTGWLVYGIEGSDAAVQFIHNAGVFSRDMIEALGISGFIVTQGLLFIGLLMAAAAWDLARKQF